MDVMDGHCDVLYQLWQQKKDVECFTQNEETLRSNYPRLRSGNVRVQKMAVFVPSHVKQANQLDVALHMIDMAHTIVESNRDRMAFVTNGDDFRKMDNRKVYIMLTLEGAEALQGDVKMVRLLYRLGVRAIGLTWNYRNAAGDGVLEPNPGGLSIFGKHLVQEMNRLHMAIDVSHLSKPAFWDCIDHSSQPIIASHSNAYACCAHPRNLTDDQLAAIFKCGGMVGITFVPAFTREQSIVTTYDLLTHIEHMLSIGGENHVGFGSDFDGFDYTISGLDHSGDYESFADFLTRYYEADIVRKLLFVNWRRYYLTLWGN